ncbi:MAG: hypothetical protein FJZ96_13440 [Chloroflexi bacterium]|nr:hypothetical protein [Chloroflexota bacterium]
MKKSYHLKITTDALQALFAPRALAVILAANRRQDGVRGQVGHPEYHFDDNRFSETRAYIEDQRALVVPSLEQGDARRAWQAFGRLTHAAQDFYAHSNYVSLWLAKHPAASPLPPDLFDPFDDALLASPDLRSGRLYYPLEVLSFIPALEGWVMPRLPRDSHAWMNLDDPGRGAAFVYASAAAVKSTRREYDLTALPMTTAQQDKFRGFA